MRLQEKIAELAREHKQVKGLANQVGRCQIFTDWAILVHDGQGRVLRRRWLWCQGSACKVAGNSALVYALLHFLLSI